MDRSEKLFIAAALIWVFVFAAMVGAFDGIPRGVDYDHVHLTGRKNFQGTNEVEHD